MHVPSKPPKQESFSTGVLPPSPTGIRKREDPVRVHTTHLLKSQAEHATHAVADLGLVLGAALAPHLGGLDVGGTLVVGLGEHAHDGDEDLLDGLDGAPALRGVLVVVRVVAGRV